MFNKFRTRKGRLEKIIKAEIANDNPNIANILQAVDEYQKDNLDTIEKLKKKKRVEVNRINGALKQSINAHGPITKELIGSASKRIYGALLVNPNDKEYQDKKYSIKSIFIGFIITTVICAIILMF